MTLQKGGKWRIGFDLKEKRAESGQKTEGKNKSVPFLHSKLKTQNWF
jgi:hypothetical protein